MIKDTFFDEVFIMKYRIKAFLLEDNNILSCRFECVLSSVKRDAR